jgi:ribosomal protein S18 acetylase RimI-like enzyme
MGAYPWAMVEYRFATPDDAAGILAFWAEAAEDAHRPSDEETAVLSLIERDPEALILAVDRSEIVGSLLAGWDGWRFHLYRLAVAPSRRGDGIARTLLIRAEARFISLGASRVDAMVLDENELGAGFWQRAGYAPQPEWSRWVRFLP